MSAPGARAGAAADHRAAPGQGHEVEVTSRDYAQTRRCSSCTGWSTRRSASTAAPRGCARLIGSAPRTRGDAAASAAAAASTWRSPTAPTTSRSPPALLGIPEANMHDYEYAVTQHRIGCRLAKRVMFPGLGAARAPAPLRRRRRRSSSPIRASRRSTTSYDFEPDPGALRAARGRHRAGRRRRPPAARRLALPPQVEPALPEVLDAARPRRRASTRWSCRAPRRSASASRAWRCPR